MSLAAVITEYNPFHRGHEYQLGVLKQSFDAVCCVMSGFAVQRGGLAIADKYTRARAAVDCGASLVTELPFPYCSGSARDFARAGVAIAKGMGADVLAFGIEDDLKTAKAIAELKHKSDFDDRLKAIIKSGAQSYQKALGTLASQALGDKARDFLTKPNNILATEYCYYASEYGLELLPIRRESEFESAGEIRDKQGEDFFASLPSASAKAFRGGSMTDGIKADTFLLSELIKKLYRADIRRLPRYYAVTSDALATLQKNLVSATGIEDLCRKCAGASHTVSYFRRAVTAIAFDVSPEMMASDPGFTVLLAADGDGRRALQKSNINIITKPADGYKTAGTTYEYAAKCELTVARCCSSGDYNPLTAKAYIKGE